MDVIGNLAVVSSTQKSWAAYLRYPRIPTTGKVLNSILTYWKYIPRIGINHFPPRDTVPTVLAAEWPLLTTMFDGDVASGPVPHLFAINPREAKAALSSDSARAFRDLQRIWSKFFYPKTSRPAGPGIS